jgi:hypothetical protein
LKLNCIHKIALFGMLAILLAAAPALAQDIRFEASVDKDKVPMNESVTLTLFVEGDKLHGLPKPELPQIDAFEVQGPSISTSFQVINSHISSSKTYSYILFPKAKGTFTIPRATLKYKGKLYSSREIKITVTDAVKAAPSQKQREELFSQWDPFGRYRQQRQLAPDDLYVRLEVEPREAFVGQPIRISYSYYQGIEQARASSIDLPNLQGFWVEDIVKTGADKGRLKTVNGRQYIVSTIFEKIIYPLSPGTYPIPPITLGVLADPFIGRVVKLNSDPVNIMVKPLPEQDRPDDFSGLVGNFGITATAQPARTRANEPVKLTVSIKGQGNLYKLLELETPDMSKLESYEPEIKEDTIVDKDKIFNAKSFTYLVIGREPGEFSIGEFSLNFFNYATLKYETVSSEPISIRIDPGRKRPSSSSQTPALQKYEITEMKREIQFIRPDRERLRDFGGLFFYRFYFWTLLLAPIVACIAAFALRRRHEKLAADSTLLRKRLATKKALARLKSARSLMSPQTEKEFYAALDHSLRNFIADKLGRSAPALSPQVIDENSNLSAAARAALEELWSRFDYQRFAPASGDLERMQSDFKNTRKLIADLNREL